MKDYCKGVLVGKKIEVKISCYRSLLIFFGFLLNPGGLS